MRFFQRDASVAWFINGPISAVTVWRAFDKPHFSNKRAAIDLVSTAFHPIDGRVLYHSTAAPPSVTAVCVSPSSLPVPLNATLCHDLKFRTRRDRSSIFLDTLDAIRIHARRNTRFFRTVSSISSPLFNFRARWKYAPFVHP